MFHFFPKFSPHLKELIQLNEKGTTNEEKANMNFRKVKFILKVKAKINNLEMLSILKVKIVAEVKIVAGVMN